MGAFGECPTEQPWVVNSNGTQIWAKQSELFHEKDRHVGTRYWLSSGFGIK